MPCVHCRNDRATRPRGLCWRCYYRLDVRDQYPSQSKFGRRGQGQDNGVDGEPALPPAGPTSALPKTEEKIVAMAGRAMARQQLFHPDDAG